MNNMEGNHDIDLQSLDQDQNTAHTRAREKAENCSAADRQNTTNGWKQGEVRMGQEQGSCIAIRGATYRHP